MTVPPEKSGVNVQVVVRCRPPNARDKQHSPLGLPVKCLSKTHDIHVQYTRDRLRTFKFDQVYDETSTQDHLYHHTIRPIVGEVLSGYNCTVFAYGQTGTGKTYTMEGEIGDFSSSTSTDRSGVIPRALKQIFGTLAKSSAESTVKISILELYNENLIDLLAPEDENEGRKKFSGGPVSTGLPKLALYDQSARRGASGISMATLGGVCISGLEEMPVRNVEDVLDILSKASDRRQKADTVIHDRSSRSHMITIISLHIKDTTDTGEELWKIGKLHLVDLAGSENIQRSGAKDQQKQEACKINQSLLTLGRVINALVDAKAHVPYRESKLTRLLQDALGGKTKTCIIATIAPGAGSLDETISTLEYAQRAKSIKNRPEINQRVTKQKILSNLRAETEELRQLLHASREKLGVYLPNEVFQAKEEEKQKMKGKIDELSQQLDECTTQLEDKSRYATQLEGAVDAIQGKLLKIFQFSQRQATYVKEHSLQYFNSMDMVNDQIAQFQRSIQSRLDGVVKDLHSEMSTKVQAYAQAHDMEIEKAETHSQDFLKNMHRHVDELNTQLDYLTSQCDVKLQSVKAQLQENSKEINGIVDELNTQFNGAHEFVVSHLGSLKSRLVNDLRPMQEQLLDEQDECASRLDTQMQSTVESMTPQFLQTVQEARDILKKAESQFNYFTKEAASLVSKHKTATTVRMKQGHSTLQTQYSHIEDAIQTCESHSLLHKDNQLKTSAAIPKRLKRSIHECHSDVASLSGQVTASVHGFKSSVENNLATAQHETSSAATSRRALQDITAQAKNEFATPVDPQFDSWKSLKGELHEQPVSIVHKIKSTSNEVTDIKQHISNTTEQVSSDITRYITNLSTIIKDRTQQPYTPLPKRYKSRNLQDIVTAECFQSPAPATPNPHSCLWSPNPASLSI